MPNVPALGARVHTRHDGAAGARQNTGRQPPVPHRAPCGSGAVDAPAHAGPRGGHAAAHAFHATSSGGRRRRRPGARRIRAVPAAGLAVALPRRALGDAPGAADCHAIAIYIAKLPNTAAQRGRADTRAPVRAVRGGSLAYGMQGTCGRRAPLRRRPPPALDADWPTHSVWQVRTAAPTT